MSNHSSDAVTALIARSEALALDLQDLSTRRLLAKQKVSNLEAEIVALGDRIEKLTQCQELARALQEVLLHSPLNKLQDVVSQGLNAVFPEHSLKVSSNVSMKYGKTYIDLLFEQTKYKFSGDPTSAFGGGANHLASLILRIFVLARHKQVLFLALDESLSGVSPWHVQACASFLQELTARMGVDILLVTQQFEFKRHTRTLEGSLDSSGFLPAMKLTELAAPT